MLPTHPWPEWLADLWAKSPSRLAEPGEGLALHTWRVLQRLHDLVVIRPELPRQVGEPRLWHRLFWACLLHDVGKVAPGFQDRLRGRRDTPAARQWGQHRHEVVSLAFVAWIFPAPVAHGAADPVASADRRWVVAAVASHHRDASEIQALYPAEAAEDLAALLGALPIATVQGVYRWLARCAAPWATALAIPGVEEIALPNESDATSLVREAGAATVCALLREYRIWLSQLEEGPCPATPEIVLRGLILQADHTASAHTRRLLPLRTSVDELRATWALANAYRHQDECARTEGSAILTAPTGSGKTEAALFWAARQAQPTGQLPRLFYALPYQASMNAMYRRLCATFSQRRVGLQHGRSLLALYRFVMEWEPEPALAARQARWRKRLAELNYFPVRVFSPYQMLKAIYRLPGYEAMLLDFQGAAFVFDEIHAYAPQRLGLLLALVDHLQRSFECRFLVMSATLPKLAQHHLASAIGPHTVIKASTRLFESFRRHRVELSDGDLLEHLDLIAGCARLGSSVLVCCNTVQRSQEAWRRLTALLEGSTVILLHGRFNGRDRLAREAIVRAAAGPDDASRRPIVLVATQVVEVSLDISFDTIFSDPAPLEALVQRFGRVNRWRRRPGLAPVHVFREPTDGQGVYDASLVRASLGVLDRFDGLPVDEAEVGRWLDLIYQGGIAEAWETDFARSFRESQRIIRTIRPFESDEGLDELFDAAFDSVEVLPVSLLAEYQRLSEDDPIRASSLLVPISDRRRRQLWRDGLIRGNGRPPIVNLPYSSELGLNLAGLQGVGE